MSEPVQCHRDGLFSFGLRWEIIRGEINIGVGSGCERWIGLLSGPTRGLAVLCLQAGLAVGGCQHAVRHGVSISAQELGSRDERDLRIGELRLEAVENGDDMRGLTA